MDKPDTLPAPTVFALEQALRTLVDNLMEHRRTWVSPNARRGAVSFGTLGRTPETVVRAIDLVDDPVSYSLKRGIRLLGKAVVELYGEAALDAMAERVCGRGRGGFGARMSPVESALEGIGSWYA
jgi:hypothetical protein